MDLLDIKGRIAMRICHVTCVHKQNDGRIFSKECTTLAKEPDFEVYLSSEGESHNINNVDIIGNGEIPKSRFKRMISFSKKVVDSAIDVNADVYHLHDPELLRYALRLKRTGAKVIFDSHENVLDEIEEKTYLPVPVRKIAKLYFTILLNYTIKRIDAVIIVTPQQEEGYKKLTSDIVLLPNYPIVNSDQTEETEKIPGKFVFAGVVADLWSQREIIEALGEIEGIEYSLFGPVDEDYLKMLQTLPGWKKTTYYGVRPFDEVQKELKRASGAFALLKPCRNTFYHEGTMGNTKLFEAMFNQTPVIATDFDLWKDVVEKNECGYLIDPNNKEEIKKAINRVLQLSTDEIKAIGARGKRAVIDEYCWEKASIDLIGLYRRLQNTIKR